MKRMLLVLASGALFGLGLVISGMSDPRNVIGFLDFTGAWRPQLAAVMAGAVGVHATLRWLVGRSRATTAVTPADVDVGGDGGCATDVVRGAGGSRRGIDGRLVAGSAIFGIGWGISGYCPGPAIVALGLGAPAAFAFIAAMVVGVLVADRTWTRDAP